MPLKVLRKASGATACVFTLVVTVLGLTVPASGQG